MKHSIYLPRWIAVLFIVTLFWMQYSALSFCETQSSQVFPRSTESYMDEQIPSIPNIILHRARVEPFNVAATGIFFLALTHTLLASWFKGKAHAYADMHNDKIHAGLADKNSFSMKAGLFHFLGEVEAIFGLWVIVLGFAVALFYNWETFVHYVNGLHYNEAMFIIVIMTIASSRPVLKLFELLMWKVVKFFGGTLEIWWLTILILSPLLGSLITEPAAMTVGAHLLAEKFYCLRPNKKLKYATLALLFVNVSIGGALTNFAAPPILMVADAWDWNFAFMLVHFGWKSILSICLSTGAYFFVLKNDIQDLKIAYEADRYRKYIQRRFISQKELEQHFDELEIEVNNRIGFTKELSAISENLKQNLILRASNNIDYPLDMEETIYTAIEEKFNDIKIGEMRRTIPGLLPENERPPYRDPNWDTREDKVPTWIMTVHILFIAWTIFNAHEPVLYIGGFLFFLGFFQITAYYQNRMNLKPALLVAFFLASLMIHGSLQAWWISPILSNLPAVGLNVTSTFLTAFNDNAAITYLSTLVPNFSDPLKYAVVTGALTGGGLTIIANAPNPVGQSILKKYFKSGISSIDLLKYALLPTLISGICFMLFR